MPAYVSGVDNVPGRQLALGSHPNPFNPLTRVAFSLAAEGFVSLDVYDMQGRLVRRLVSEERAAGPHSVVWDGLDGDGRRVGSGVYVARLAADGQSAEHKMVLLK
jgi:flagellar hook assembly protein FlgD